MQSRIYSYPKMNMKPWMLFLLLSSAYFVGSVKGSECASHCIFMKWESCELVFKDTLCGPTTLCAPTVDVPQSESYSDEDRTDHSCCTDVSCAVTKDNTFRANLDIGCDNTKGKECKCHVRVLAHSCCWPCHFFKASSTTPSTTFVPPTPSTATDRAAGGEGTAVLATWEIAAAVAAVVLVIAGIIAISVVVYLRHRKTNEPQEAFATNSAVSQPSRYLRGPKDKDKVSGKLERGNHYSLARGPKSANDNGLADPDCGTSVSCHILVVEEPDRDDDGYTRMIDTAGDISPYDLLTPPDTVSGPSRAVAASPPTRHRNDPDTDKYDPDTDKYDPDTDKYDPDTDKYDPDTDKYDPDTDKYDRLNIHGNHDQT